MSDRAAPDRVVPDRVIIVTGGLSGIGAAVAERFARAGARVVAADLASDATRLEDAPIAPLHLDVADEASVQTLVDAVQKRHGRIDALVNAAGIGRDVPFLETSAEMFDRIIAVNLRGTFLAGRACARVMATAGRGAIVNIGSIAGMRGSIGRAAYGTSKGGVVVLSQVMATELAPLGVRVNVIAPGPIDTPLVSAMHDEAIRAAWTRAVPMHRYGTPDDVAAAALFLCSEDARFITGHVLAVDGGFLGAGLAGR